ncbi:hypothetical protein XA68_12000 [Ophiocordyceps unilateralis]|uniref:Uncharacterized protein n=1 Tax=Ophiocordyceps unilateralis TaxID=268505 RepID=A0A2A9PPG7_OPHUN|nr:hypothetical protein XA68_12000 [Ophiocordyceps unilateralis]
MVWRSRINPTRRPYVPESAGGSERGFSPRTDEHFRLPYHFQIFRPTTVAEVVLFALLKTDTNIKGRCELVSILIAKYGEDEATCRHHVIQMSGASDDNISSELEMSPEQSNLKWCNLTRTEYTPSDSGHESHRY